MTDTVERRLFLHTETDRALLVSTSNVSTDPRVWLPQSQVTINHRRVAFNRHAATNLRVPIIKGRVVDLTIPAWLAERNGLTESADVPDEDFVAPQCPHGEPMNQKCDDCVRERIEATA